MSDPSTESRDLMAQLHAVQSSMKPGDPQREVEEDRIFQRLFELSKQMQEDPAPFVAGGLDVSEKKMYMDDSKMFTRHPLQPKLVIFLQRMTSDMMNMDPEKMREIVSNPKKDGAKDLVRGLVHHGGRGKYFHHVSQKTCKNCWYDIMKQIASLLIEVILVDLNDYSSQLKKLIQNKKLSLPHAQDLTYMLQKSFRKVDSLEKKTKQLTKKSKKAWLDVVEQLYLLLAVIHNSLKMKHNEMLQLKEALEDNNFVSGFLT